MGRAKKGGRKSEKAGDGGIGKEEYLDDKGEDTGVDKEDCEVSGTAGGKDHKHPLLRSMNTLPPPPHSTLPPLALLPPLPPSFDPRLLLLVDLLM